MQVTRSLIPAFDFSGWWSFNHRPVVFPFFNGKICGFSTDLLEEAKVFFGVELFYIKRVYFLYDIGLSALHL